MGGSHSSQPGQTKSDHLKTGGSLLFYHQDQRKGSETEGRKARRQGRQGKDKKDSTITLTQPMTILPRLTRQALHTRPFRRGTPHLPIHPLHPLPTHRIIHTQSHPFTHQHQHQHQHQNHHQLNPLAQRLRTTLNQPSYASLSTTQREGTTQDTTQGTEYSYHAQAEHTLEHLHHQLEDLLDALARPQCMEDTKMASKGVVGGDVEYAAGVLSLSLIREDGREEEYVVNKQPASRQIWLSSPISSVPSLPPFFFLSFIPLPFFLPSSSPPFCPSLFLAL